MERYAHITGWGMYAPEKVLTNDDLSKMVDTNDEWIRSRTGICERHIAGHEETTASLATEAALRALQMAHLRTDELDLIIVATSSPEHIFPATACIVQDRIGAVKAGAFDMLAACSGFIFALNMATNAIRSGTINNALVIGAETLSRLVNWQDRETCILFGDGAGAFVLQCAEEPAGVLSSVMRSDGSGCDLLSLPAGGSRLPASVASVHDGLHYIHMNGREVFRFATRVMAQATREVLEGANLKLDDLSLLIPHQANKRIIDAAVRSLDIPMERCMVNLDHYGNTSTASIPIATCEAVKAGRLKPGDHVVFVGFGAGLTWGASAVKWSGPISTPTPLKPTHFRTMGRVRSFILRFLRYLESFFYG